MVKIYLRNTFISLLFLIFLTAAVTFSSGPGGGYTNAPSEYNCTNCHSGSLITSGNANLNKILLKPHFPGNGYMPDSTYSMELTFKQSGISKFGFEITCLNSTSNSPEGTFTASNSRVQKTTAFINSKTRQYLEQTNAGTASVATDSTRWVLTWKAPSSNVGKVKFYVVINATNNNNSDNGDIIYAKTFEYPCAASLPVANATSNDTVVCTNTSATFKGSGTNSPTSYSWKFTGSSTSSSTSQNPTITFNTPGIQYAILTVSNIAGASTPDTVKVVVNPSPPASINGTSATICQGDSILLNANTAANITYKWSPSGKTSKSIYVKDTGIYYVTTKSVVNGCTTKSANFRLNQYPKPGITISRTSNKDTFCHSYSDVLTASGTNIDSILWYVNGQVYARNKGNSYALTLTQSGQIEAVGKSINKCLSIPSNKFSIVVVKKVFPANIMISKTTSDIHLSWNQSAGTDSMKYSVNSSGFLQPASDSTLILNGLTANTIYNITIRTFQKSPCLFTDTLIQVKTNACSNLNYFIISPPRICKGSDFKCTVRNLYKAKYSISFNNNSYSNDTIFTLQPLKSDSILIQIQDSLSLGCPPIVEKVKYLVDSLPAEPGYGPVILSCDSEFLYQRSPGFQTYEFYKNNMLVSSGISHSFLFTKLVSGDQLMSKAVLNSCSKTYISTFRINQSYTAGFTYMSAGKNYTFKALDSQSTTYNWRINGMLKGHTNPLVLDMTAYKNSNIKVSLAASDNTGCSDSTVQNIAVPDITSIDDLLFGTDIRIYPIPTEGLLNMETSSEHAYRYQLFSLDGKLLIENTFTGKTSEDLKLFSKGIYILRIRDDKRLMTIKIELR
jgi:hypothetical protein